MQFYPPTAGAEWLPQATNAVLWTIRLEILSYAFVALLMSLSLLKPGRQAMTVVIVVVLAALSVVYLPNVKVMWISQQLFVLPSLCCGIFMNWLVRFHRPRGSIALLFTLGHVPAALYGVLPGVFCFFVAYLAGFSIVPAFQMVQLRDCLFLRHLPLLLAGDPTHPCRNRRRTVRV